jgi:competence protein ComEC
MTRFEPSVLRACAMAACSMLALAVGRPTAGLRALALAVIVLLCADPLLVHSIGFQLSCAASVGIAAFSVPIAARVPGPPVLRDTAGASLGAQLGVAPVLVLAFGAVPLMAVPANLVAAPFVGPLTISGLVSGVAGGIVRADVVGVAAGFPAYVCASAILAIAHTAARVPVALGALDVAVLAAVAVMATFARRRACRATWRRASLVADRRVALPPR